MRRSELVIFLCLRLRPVARRAAAFRRSSGACSSPGSLAQFGHLALRLGERRERLLRGGHRHQLVEVPRLLRRALGLHLDQVAVEDDAVVLLADACVAGEEVLELVALELGDDLLPLVALGARDRLQIRAHRGEDAGLIEARALAELLLEAAAPGPARGLRTAAP